MADIYLNNSLSRKKEKFVALKPPNVGIYSCGPTVYGYAHIGHLRRYVGDDVLKRALELNGYKVKHVMNVTDVGHLTSDADTGEDKVEKAAKKLGKSAWDVAKFFEKQFFASTKALNIKRPDVVSRATEHISDQIELIKKLEEKDFTYKTGDGIYFDTSKLTDYGKLGGEKKGIKPGARVDVAGKKNPTDFALWKFSPKDKKRQMEWSSPWGVGFPGWHIECSAMSMKYLGETFDIHTGGIDHLLIHHPNEIAQSETATGKPFARFWLHHEFLQVDGRKMSKSLGNLYTIDDVKKKGFGSLSLRYLYLTAHYKDPLNFTWESLGSAQNALNKLRSQVSSAKDQKSRTTLSPEKQVKLDDYREKFISTINDDLNTPQALAVLWEMMKSNIPSEDKYDLALFFDEVLGLKLAESMAAERQPTAEVKKLVEEREKLRSEGKFKEADKVRKKIQDLGFVVEDTGQGPKIKLTQ
jgi:cysteinyl-tRNA synthetase